MVVLGHTCAMVLWGFCAFIARRSLTFYYSLFFSFVFFQFVLPLFFLIFLLFFWRPPNQQEEEGCETKFGELIS